MDKLLWMHCYVRAIESGSFSAVAREMSIGQPNVSRHIASLEQHLGVRLLHRSTRKLSPTPEGERFYTEARRIVDAIAEAESNARGEETPRGFLRVSCPVSLGRSHVLPLVKPFLAQYPEIELELMINDRFIDLIEDGVDLTIRIGNLTDSSLNARRIGLAERVCVASADYLKRHPVPRMPHDLQGHDCIIYTLRQPGNIWSFAGLDVTVAGRFRVNSPEGIHSAVLDGLGIGAAPCWIFNEELRSGLVVPLLTEHPMQAVPIHIVYPAKRLLSRRAAVFMDFVSAAFARLPDLNEGALAHALAK